jgi:hypothetical protein
MRDAAHRRLDMLIGDPERPDLVALQELAVKDVARLATVACEIERSALYRHRQGHENGRREIHITVLEDKADNKDDFGDGPA